MKLTKPRRAKLREMFGGLCAYCGQPLGERWHADHVQPVMRELTWKKDVGLVATGQLHRPQHDTIENLMPACAPCNLDKASYTLDQWRSKLEGSAASLARYNSTYRHAFRFGLIKPVAERVVFHFEVAGVRP